jgi:hypothetical protein
VEWKFWPGPDACTGIGYVRGVTRISRSCAAMKRSGACSGFRAGGLQRGVLARDGAQLLS